MNRQERKRLARLEIEAGVQLLEDERADAHAEAAREWRELMEDMGDLMTDVLGIDFGSLIQPFVANVSYSLTGGIYEISLNDK